METKLSEGQNLWPTSTIAGGESPYIFFKTAKTSLQRVCKEMVNKRNFIIKDRKLMNQILSVTSSISLNIYLN